MIPLVIFIGAGIGGVARYGMNVASAKLVLATGFPFGTLIVNVVGCFLIGIAAALLPRHAFSGYVFPFLVTGLLGGFTTFSAFSLESVQLLQKQQTALALLYMASSVVITLFAVYAGIVLGQMLTRT